MSTTHTHNGVEYPDTIVIRGGILNTHTHPRDFEDQGDGRADLFVPYYSGVYDDVIAIGNTKVPLTTPMLAWEQKRRWQAISPCTRIHIAGIMTENTKPEDVIAGYDQPYGVEAWIAMKMFLRSVSNSGGADVDDVRKIIPVVEAMTYTKWKYKRKPMVLKVHCERKFTPLGRRIDMMNREAAAVERDIEYILQEVPEAVIEICHMSDGNTVEAVEYYQRRGYNVYGEAPPQYANYTLEDLFEDEAGGTAFNPKVLCWPIFKTKKDRRIIHDAMLSGKPWYYFGNDEACHDHDTSQETGVKTNVHGKTVGGQTKVPSDEMSGVIEEFVRAGRTEYLNAFVGGNAREIYSLEPRNELETIFKFSPHEVPHTLTKRLLTKTINCVVAAGGQERLYVPKRPRFQ
jgi:dihydroorotase